MQPSERTHQRCAFVTFAEHASALAATAMSGNHRMAPNEPAVVVRFADNPSNKRHRSW